MLLRRYAKAAVLVMVLLILVVEGYFGYRWYERYYGLGAPAPGASSTASPKPGEDASGTTFAHVATDANSRGDYTYLSDPSIDGDPNAVVFATPTATGGGDYGHNIGVWYEPEARKWAIFNQDLVAVPPGATFEVSIPPEGESFVHRSTPENTTEDGTYLDHLLVNGKPNAGVSVTQTWNPGGGRGVYNDQAVDARYDAGRGAWEIRNEDGAAMPDGAAFNVTVSGSAEPTG